MKKKISLLLTLTMLLSGCNTAEKTEQIMSEVTTSATAETTFATTTTTAETTAVTTTMVEITSDNRYIDLGKDIEDINSFAYYLTAYTEKNEYPPSRCPD